MEKKIESLVFFKLLKVNGSICADVIILFNEVYLQKCEEYSCGSSIGSDSRGVETLIFCNVKF